MPGGIHPQEDDFAISSIRAFEEPTNAGLPTVGIIIEAKRAGQKAVITVSGANQTTAATVINAINAAATAGTKSRLVVAGLMLVIGATALLLVAARDVGLGDVGDGDAEFVIAVVDEVVVVAADAAGGDAEAG